MSGKRTGTWRLAIATAAVMFSLPVSGAGADVFTVTNNTDSATPGSGSLRAQIAAANDDPDAPHTIDATGRTGTIQLASALPNLTRSMTIQGPGANLLTVRRDSTTRFAIFNVNATTTIRGLTIANGASPTTGSSGGGGISSTSTLTVDRSAVVGNTASNGGGIRSIGALTVTDSTLSGNNADSGGGGIQSAGGTLTLRNSTVSGNTANGGTTPRAGGIAAGGTTTTIANSTVSANTAPLGANLDLPTGRTTTIRSSIVSNPLGGGGNCSGGGVWGSQGFNIESANSCAFGQATDQPNTDPQLGPLQDNGGPTQTMALPSTSPAVDKGDAGTLTADQRGRTRPMDFGFIANAAGGDGADIGAYELQSAQGPPDPGGSPPPGDQSPSDVPPELDLSGKKKQDLRKRVTVKATVDEAATLTGTGKLVVKETASGKAQNKAKTYKLRPATADVSAGAKTTLKLKLRKKGLKAARRVGKAKARITVSAVDSAGNADEASRTVRLKDED